MNKTSNQRSVELGAGYKFVLASLSIESSASINLSEAVFGTDRLTIIMDLS
jgi:hypothetical protein